MFFTDLMIGTHDRTFEKAPDVLNGVSMNITLNPFVSTVINRLVLCSFIRNTFVSRRIISIDLIRCGMTVNKGVKRLFIGMFNDIKRSIAATLNRTYYQSLIALIAVSLPSTVPPT